MTFPGPVSPGLTLLPWRRGGGDPCYRVAADQAIWRTALLGSGAVTARIARRGVDAVHVALWGDGAAEYAEQIPDELGAGDDRDGFAPQSPPVAAALRRVPHLRLGRSNRVLEALVPAVLEQRVQGVDAFRAWRLLVTRFGSPAPGPAPAGMRVPPSARGWQTIPSWEFHRANVDPGRARTVVTVAARAAALERLGARSAADARAVLTSLPGVGMWTAAETAQRAFGDADALSVGDYHLCKQVGWALLGRLVDDDTMVELLEPMRPHRHRATRLLAAAGRLTYPRRGPRLPVPDIAAH